MLQHPLATLINYISLKSDQGIVYNDAHVQVISQVAYQYMIVQTRGYNIHVANHIEF